MELAWSVSDTFPGIICRYNLGQKSLSVLGSHWLRLKRLLLYQHWGRFLKFSHTFSYKTQRLLSYFHVVVHLLKYWWSCKISNYYIFTCLIWLPDTCMHQQLVRWRITHLHLHRQFNYILARVPCLKNKPHHLWLCVLYLMIQMCEVHQLKFCIFVHTTCVSNTPTPCWRIIP